ncbi:hypothetical protein CAMGR0001_1604 [Campylobacter gracilis RM3268]|uniref:Uncharacterized protein n=1 Tax=Campylobacter gracilis RM3268 TaxID=553220 RepID=C8PIE3_9BACT|nr:hypothetical protein CAMGR0001_1604 [Campylobacter gracilis RM3268]
MHKNPSVKIARILADFKIRVKFFEIFAVTLDITTKFDYTSLIGCKL